MSIYGNSYASWWRVCVNIKWIYQPVSLKAEFQVGAQ